MKKDLNNRASRGNALITKMFVAASLAITSVVNTTAQTTFKLDSSFNSNGIFSTNGLAGNNAQAFATGGILNNDGTVWLAGGINGTGNSSWLHYISRLKANGTADSSFCGAGAYGFQYNNWQTMGFLNEIYPLKNGGVYATHSGYGGYYAASPTVATVSKEVYQEFDASSIVGTAQVNDSVIVQLSANDIQTYKGVGANAYAGFNWFDNGTNYYGPLPKSSISSSTVNFQGILTQSNQKILVYGYIDSSNYAIPFLMRLKKNSFNQLDSTFGTNGISYAMRSVFPLNQITATYVQNDDKIILHDREYFVRLNVDGSLDNSLPYFKINSSSSGVGAPINAKKFVTNSTNTEIYGIDQSFSGDHTIFGAYMGGSGMPTFHKGKNYFRKLDTDVNYSGYLSLNDISINANGDLLVVGTAVKVPNGVYEIFAMKLKKGSCNAITIATQQLNDTTITVNISGTTTNPIVVSHLPETPGVTLINGTSSTNIKVAPGQNYTLVVVDGNGCSSSKVLTTNPMGIGNYTQNTTFIISPNPANDRIVLNLPSTNNNAIYNIISVDGKVLQSNILAGNTLDIATLPRGLYFVKVKDGAREFTSKFMKY